MYISVNLCSDIGNFRSTSGEHFFTRNIGDCDAPGDSDARYTVGSITFSILDVRMGQVGTPAFAV
jgi:hypothetical protein